jgi:hypothetical protein
MPDLLIFVKPDGGTRQRVTAPGDMMAEDFLKDLLEGLNLTIVGNGVASPSWSLEDKKTGRVLRLDHSLTENGVQAGDELLVSADHRDEQSPKCPHCGFVDDSGVLSPKFCRRCGKPRIETPQEIRVYVHRLDAETLTLEISPAMITEKLIDRAMPGYSSEPAAWTLYDKDSGRLLNPAISLEENGVTTERNLYLQKKSTPQPLSRLRWMVMVGCVLGVLLVGLALWKYIARGTVTLSPSTADLRSSQTMQFAVRQGNRDLPAVWSLSPRLGTIDSSGLYKSPEKIGANSRVTVSATTSEPKNTSTAVINLIGDSSTSSVNGGGTSGATVITPATATLAAGESVRFSVPTQGIAGPAVRWSITPEVGTISADGTYTAPAAVPLESTVKVTANTSDNGSSSVDVVLTPISVALHASTSLLRASETFQLRATVKGTSNHGVNWSVSGPGSISVNGVYTAPLMLTTEQEAKVTATSAADSSKSATVSLKVQPPVLLLISPATVTMFTTQRMRFTVSLSGSSDTRVRLTLAGPGNLLADGTYEAPASIPKRETAVITATSVSNPDKSATARVELNPVIISINPASVEMRASQQMRFGAEVTGTTNTALRWSLLGSGALSANGLYIAPASIPSDQNARVTATSVADPSQSATAFITLMHSNFARTGVLTWVGSLEKNATVTIDDAGASRGSVQGTFPGLPIQIALDNPKEFSVMDAPGPSNGWKRITIRSNRGHGTTVRIAWFVISGGGMP